jgi:bacteriocin biosynthesis cyclodehydratase domain-containing protein
MKHPKLRADATVIPHSPDELEIRIGVWNTITSSLVDEERSGALLQIVSRLDGSQSTQDIARATGVPRSVVEGVIESLINLNALQDGVTSPLELYLQHLASITPASAPDKPERVGIVGPSRLTSAVSRALSDAQVASEVIEIGDDSDIVGALRRAGVADLSGDNHPEMHDDHFGRLKGMFLILITSSPDLPLAYGLNRASVRFQIPWLHATLDGPVAFIGPTFSGSGGPCYTCFEKRIEMNVRERDSYLRYKRAIAEARTVVSQPRYLEALENLVVAHTALEAINMLSTGNTFTRDKALCMYLPTMEFSYNRVLSLTGCPTCDPDSQIRREKYFDLAAALSDETAQS